MKYFKTFLFAIGLIVFYHFIAPNRIYGYLDGASGSYIIQILIAIAVGGVFGIKIFWRRIFGFFKNIHIKRNKNDKIPG